MRRTLYLLICIVTAITLENQWWVGITGASETSRCLWGREWIIRHYVHMVGSWVSLLVLWDLFG